MATPIDENMIKQMSIKNPEGSAQEYDTRNIGAEAENIIISKKDGKIVPVNTTGATQESLVDTLNNFGGGSFVGYRVRPAGSTTATVPREMVWEELTTDEKAKYDMRNESIVSFLDDEDEIEDDINENIMTFTSEDTEDPALITGWTAVNALTSGEKLKIILNKVSTMFKNIRWLNKKLGTTNISTIGDGTVTGAIKYLNENTGDPVLPVDPLVEPTEEGSIWITTT